LLNADNGISTGTGCTVTNCSAYSNSGNGISTGIGCTVTNCSASRNTITGISTGIGSTVTNCSAFLNTGSGISVSSGSTVTSCSSYQNNANGIIAGEGNTVSSCTAFDNTGSGISVSPGSTVVDCTTRFNILDGIVCSSQCVILANTCSTNGRLGNGAGIHATGGDTRIEGNNCTNAPRGIDVDLAGNIIIKNTCSGNATNWDIVANNVCGPILDRTAPASAAILGNSAPSSLGSTDPNANFTY
ncbi:MAG: right-handed parallel beta-helix repeat-containing protein, partial [Phycisphaerales bacterium]|nr:right-handed parallel beta-helix repeat-containing protein [Phycisphaerales bacterium]